METSRKDYNMSSDEMQVPFRIDPEFENKIPPIGEEEFQQLRENILTAGEVYEPLVKTRSLSGRTTTDMC